MSKPEFPRPTPGDELIIHVPKTRYRDETDVPVRVVSVARFRITVEHADEKHADRQVTYDPEKPGDRTPWRLVRGEARFPAAECRPTSLHGGPWALARLLRINVP